ncbi:MAG: hypothetical protein ACR2IG_05985 [Roseomonas sp.]
MLGRRALLTGLLLTLGAGAALAQNAAPAAPRPNQARSPEQRRRQRQAEKTVTAPEPPGRPAPIPNRDIEAPRGFNEAPRARLSPTMIDPAPAQPHLGGSGFAMQAQEDRLLQKPMPGARLNVPF